MTPKFKAGDIIRDTEYLPFRCIVINVDEAYYTLQSHSVGQYWSNLINHIEKYYSLYTDIFEEDT